MTKIAVVDIETTGTDPSTDLIVEIGIVELDLDTGNIKEIFDSCVRERKFGELHRRSWIFLNSSLSYEEVIKAPLFDNFKQELQEIFNSFPITSFNTSFDLEFLRERGYKFPRELPCIMVSSTEICKIPHRNRGYGYKWPKVQEAWDYFFPSSTYIEGHRAADDAAHEAKILLEMYNRGFYPI
jgi:DNA polymerase-3 subunit epsilon